MPSGPVMMMFTDPVGTVFVPPRAVVPRMMVVPIAVGATPIIVTLGPFGVMPIDPARMIIMPPIGVVPCMMFVPVTIMMMLGVCHHRRSREERSQSCPGEKSSKFHSWYLLKEQWEVEKIHLTGSNTMHRKCQFQALKKAQKNQQFSTSKYADSRT